MAAAAADIARSDPELTRLLSLQLADPHLPGRYRDELLASVPLHRPSRDLEHP